MNEHIKNIITMNITLQKKRFLSLFPEEYRQIMMLTNYLPNNHNLKERQYHILNNLKEIPKCKTCRKNTKWSNNINKGYTKYCSRRCKDKNRNLREKTKQTNLKRYGVENPSQNEETKQKKIQTSLEHYGVTHPKQTKEVQNKFKQTNIERYGVEYPQQNKEIQEKTKYSNLKKYGVEYGVQRESIKKKRHLTFKNNTFEISQKTKQTNLERYGVEYPQQNKEIREKVKQTNIERYGVKHPSQNKEVQNKQKQTNIERYGVEWTTQSEKVKIKKRKTNLERYGVENPSTRHISKETLTKLNNRDWLYKQHYILKRSLSLISQDLGDIGDCAVGKYLHNHNLETQRYSGYYCEHYFNEHPKEKLKDAFLYIIQMYNKFENFIKVGITTGSVTDRWKYVKHYKITILLKIPLPLYSAWLIEQEVLKIFKSHKYNPENKIGGDSECLLIECYDNILNGISNILS